MTNCAVELLIPDASSAMRAEIADAQASIRELPAGSPMPVSRCARLVVACCEELAPCRKLGLPEPDPNTWLPNTCMTESELDPSGMLSVSQVEFRVSW